MTTVLLMWNIGLTYFCVRLLWDIVKLETDVKDTDEFVRVKLESIYADAKIIAKCLEWRNNNETKEQSEEA